MTFGLGITLGAILGLLLVSAFFSGSETALTAASRRQDACARGGRQPPRARGELPAHHPRALHRRHPARQHARQRRRLGARHQPVPDPVRRRGRGLRHHRHDGDRGAVRRGAAQDLRHPQRRPHGACRRAARQFRGGGAGAGDRHHAVPGAPHFAAVRRLDQRRCRGALGARGDQGRHRAAPQGRRRGEARPRHAGRRARSSRADRLGHHGAPDQDGRDRRRSSHRGRSSTRR